MTKNQEPKNQYQKILEKIENQSKEKKQQRAFNIMKGQSIKNTSYQPINLLTTIIKFLNQKQTKTARYFKIKENRHTAIMSIFLVFSSYLCWTIERKYDVLRRKAKKSQTFKQRQVEQENDYIEKMLNKKQFEPVPIPDQLDEQNTYKFQERETKRGGFVIDTKQDLMDLIQNDKINRKSNQGLYDEQTAKNLQTL